MATHTEIHTIIKTRVGWKQEIDSPINVSAINLVTDSGRFFQDEHSSVTIRNIMDSQPVVDISQVNMNTILTQLRDAAVYRVISDVFKKKDIVQAVVDANETLFDEAILLQMVIMVSEIIITSSRSNKSQRFGDGFIDKLHFDVIGSSNVRFAVTNRNYKYSMGITSRYGVEINELQRFLGQSKMLKSITRGESTNINVIVSDELPIV